MKRLTITGLAGALTAGAVVLVASAQQLGDRPTYWPATLPGKPVLKEWFSDIPWHQKLGTFAGNEIDAPIVMPYAVMDQAAKAHCTSKGYSEERCMIELGVNNILGMLRTDTLYDPTVKLILDAAECKKGQPCIEVMLEVSNFYTTLAKEDRRVPEFNDPGNPDVKLVPHTFGKEVGIYEDGFVITDGSTYGAQMPWYMSHYCDSQFKGKDVQDPVCYADYLSPMNSGFNAFGKGATDWPRSVPWSVYPMGSGPNNHCKEGLTTCTIVLGAFDLRDLQQNLGNPTFQYQKYNQFLFTWFNDALKNFATDFSPEQLQHHFPWNGGQVSWETFLYPQGVQNPFSGEFPHIQTAPANGAGCDKTLTGPTLTPPNTCDTTATLRTSPLVYPRQCSLADLATGNATKLRNCGLNYELHPNGWNSQWPESYRDPSWMNANQYGRTSFLFAGVPGMQMPVSFYKDPASASGLSIYEQVHNASIFSLYLPIANEADRKRAYSDRQYGDLEFYHTLLMSNHMESDPLPFANGIRGKVLWHNEYRTQKMYGNNDKYPEKMFPAAFAPNDAKAPFHNNTCDGCHVRNGSGIPINTENKLDATLQEFMKGDPYNPTKDYTFTGQVRPMKLVLFDLHRDTTRLDASRFSEPLAFPANFVAPLSRTAEDLYYNNKIMNFYGDSFHVTMPGYSYVWNYVTASSLRDDPVAQREFLSRMVVSTPRVNAELNNKIYEPRQVKLGAFQISAPCQLVLPAPTKTKPWPSSCDEVNGAAIGAAIDGGDVGFILLNGKRLGNLSAMEAIPNQAILGFQASQIVALTSASACISAGCAQKIAGEIVWNAGARDGVSGKGKVHKECRTKSPTDCYIARFGWLGDRVSLEDQVANAAFVEMNMTTKDGYKKLYGNSKVLFPIRYAYPNCGPANKTCGESSGNGDLSERDVELMADYARWLGNPTRSEFQVALPEVIAGEKTFRQLKCDTCHVIRKIDIVPDDTMLTKDFRDRLTTRAATPFLSYIGTDLLMHDMGYLSQLGNAKEAIRDSDGVVMPKFQNYVQKIRTPALKGLRFNRFVTDSHNNTKNAATDPACDFLLHDGRACDAIEAAFLHDGPAINKLGVVDGLNRLTPKEMLELRAFLYSL